ncbi:MAG: hypothetical protein ACI9AF_000377 [Granulosicoccus sp.]|jgi:hypothetical protein
MFFLGQDVSHPSGNFLVEQGFERCRSLGAKGTSRYRLPWQGGHIELYGACAGWYGDKRGFTFIRPRRRCAIWLSGEETPIPGAWRLDLIEKGTSRSELYFATFPFLDWLISYERIVQERFGLCNREQNYSKYLKVPKAKAWIEPATALHWFECFRERPDELVRPKQISPRLYA